MTIFLRRWKTCMVALTSCLRRLIFFAPEAVLRAQPQTAQVAQALLAPLLLLAPAVGGELLIETRARAQQPDHQLIREIFQPFHKSLPGAPSARARNRNLDSEIFSNAERCLPAVACPGRRAGPAASARLRRSSPPGAETGRSARDPAGSPARRAGTDRRCRRRNVSSPTSSPAAGRRRPICRGTARSSAPRSAPGPDPLP